MLYFVLYFIIVVPLAWTHDALARLAGRSFSRSYFSNTHAETYWTIVDRVRQRRAFVIAFLIALTSTVFFLSYLSLDLIDERYGFTTYEYFLYIIVAISITYVVEEILDQNRVLTDCSGHPDRIKVQRIVETLAMTAGIGAPQLIFYAGSTPKLFLQVPTVGKPRINVSTSFLQHFNETEAEAYIAHEIGHYLSKEVTAQRVVAALLAVLKISGLIMFMSLLALVHHSLPLVWVGAYVSIAVWTLLEKDQLRFAFRDISFLFLVMNPVHLATITLSSFIHFMMNYGEMVYADLKAIELTRFPQGLYSALLKVMHIAGSETHQDFWFRLPSSSNRKSERDEAFEEHLIKERLRLIKSFDETVTESYSPIPTLRCSVCGETLADTPVSGPHEIISHVWVCHSCNHLWFDKGAFYALSSIKSNEFFTKFANGENSANKRKPPFFCPRCTIALSEVLDKAFPESMHIYFCQSCHGNLVHPSDFVRYTNHRLSTIKKNGK